MKHVALTRLELVNFRSFLKRSIIDLSPAAGLKLVSGNNLVEPALGANGSGKSTVWDALCFALYGTSIKGLRASDLTSHGADATSVTAVLSVGDARYEIKRTAPPNRTSINGKAVEQADIDELIGLSRTRFLNAVVFGQAMPLFIDLPVPARGDLLDEVLQLELWMEAASKASARHNGQAADLAILQTNIAYLKGRIEGLPDIAELEAREARWEEERQGRLSELDARAERVAADHDALKAGIVTQAPIDLDAIRTKRDDQRERMRVYAPQVGGLQTRLADLKQSIEFFGEAKDCPTCGQEITAEFAANHLDHLKSRCDEVASDIAQLNARLEKATSKASTFEAEWQAAHRHNAAARQAQAVAQERFRAKAREREDIETQIARVSREVNPHTATKDQAVADKQRFAAELAVKQREEQSAIAGLAGLNYWRQGFRKVRLFCLENVLQELTVETRNSLLALGLVDWRIAFKTATETKSGSLKLGVQVDVQPPDRAAGRFDVLSGGEGQRARLAASLGLANLIQRWAGVRYSFAVFDEPTAWLSEQGVEDLLDNLAHKADAEGKSIWLLDHRALQHSAFAETYLVEKDVGGSRWRRV